jgi:hypothetical protein
MFKIRRLPRLFGASAVAMFCAYLGNAQVLSSPNLLPTTTQAPDGFGTQDYSVTTISATSFTADENSGWYTTLCCLSRAFSGGAGEFYASVNIPTGAVIDYIGLESYSTCAGVAGVELWQVNHGSTSGIAAFSSTVHSYATDYNAGALGWQVNSSAGSALALQVELSSACANYPAFSWVEIWWRRVVSPAPATATFNDVPTSDPAFQFVEALAASGITAGCGGGNYCPDAPLTRRQMAVFLSKALGLHWPN